MAAIQHSDLGKPLGPAATLRNFKVVCVGHCQFLSSFLFSLFWLCWVGSSLQVSKPSASVQLWCYLGWAELNYQHNKQQTKAKTTVIFLLALCEWCTTVAVALNTNICNRPWALLTLIWNSQLVAECLIKLLKLVFSIKYLYFTKVIKEHSAFVP